MTPREERERPETDEEQALRILVESMVRAGRSEREIVTAVNEATAKPA